MSKNNRLFVLAVLVSGILTSPTTFAEDALVDVAPAVLDEQSEILERGEDFAVHRSVTSLIDTTGAITYRTNQFTVLENALHYFENGEWKQSEDLVESFPGGAIARRGPHRAIFSPELNVESVFDIEMSDRKRLRGGVRAIQLTDMANGKSFTLGTVRQSVKGRLLPPNQVLYANAFEGGVEADVLLIWKHNAFLHEVVLRSRPELPEGMNPQSTRLEIVTEFVDSTEPVLDPQQVRVTDEIQMDDDTLIDFGSAAILRGSAFAVEQRAIGLSAQFPADPEGAPVLKQWQKSTDGRRFLVESVGWSDLWPQLQNLPVAQGANTARQSKRQVASSRIWPKRPDAGVEQAPMEVAALAYEPKGVLVDFPVNLSGSSSSYTFLSGTTYSIASSFSVGSGTATFQPGCVVKYANNACLLLYGYVSFPPAGQVMPVFTHKDDDLFGEQISGSDHVPAAADGAAQAVWIYYVTAGTTIQNARFRYAKKAVQYDQNPGVYATHTLKDSLFQECQTGVYFNLPAYTLTLSNVRKCNVTTPIIGPGCPPTCYYYGSFNSPDDCGPFYTIANFAGIRRNEPLNVTTPADVMGAVGPDHFVEMINAHVRVFNKYTGQAVGNQSLADFFGVSTPGDPRIVYNHYINRWVACAMNGTAGDLYLAVSIDSSPGTGASLSANWHRYPMGAQRTCCIIDYPSLGFDVNGVYMSLNYVPIGGCQPSCYSSPQLFAVRNQDLTPNPATITPQRLVTPVSSTIQPAVIHNNSSGLAWFVTLDGFKNVKYGRVKWNGTTAQYQGTDGVSWNTADHYSTVVPSFDSLGGIFNAPNGTSGATDLGVQGTKLMMAFVHGGFLWTCHQIGVDSTGTYTSSSDRSACQWMKFQIIPDGSGSYKLDTVDYGRVFDSATSNPWFFYMPSLAVNSSGDMVMGVSRSRTGAFIDAAFVGRKATDTWGGGVHQVGPLTVKVLKSGLADFSGVWGDYTYTTLDAKDGLTLWTIQQYAFTSGDVWGTWIGGIAPF